MNFPHELRVVNYRRSDGSLDTDSDKEWKVDRQATTRGLVIPISGGDASVNVLYRSILETSIDYTFSIYLPVKRFAEIIKFFNAARIPSNRARLDVINVPGKFNPFRALTSYEGQVARLPTTFLDKVNVLPTVVTIIKAYNLSSFDVSLLTDAQLLNPDS